MIRLATLKNALKSIPPSFIFQISDDQLKLKIFDIDHAVIRLNDAIVFNDEEAVIKLPEAQPNLATQKIRDKSFFIKLLFAKKALKLLSI